MDVEGWVLLALSVLFVLLIFGALSLSMYFGFLLDMEQIKNGVCIKNSANSVL